jgi:hypothetical protein
MKAVQGANRYFANIIKFSKLFLMPILLCFPSSRDDSGMITGVE